MITDIVWASIIEFMAHTTIIVDEITAIKLAVPNSVFTGVVKEISAFVKI